MKAFVCRRWLAQYRLEGAHMQGNAAVFGLSRTDLRRWYYVEKLTPAQIKERYLQEHGVYAHHDTLLHWLRAPAQAPERLENDNECIHTHPACGEYILEQLQQGPCLGETDCHMTHGTDTGHMCIVRCTEKANACSRNFNRSDFVYSPVFFFPDRARARK